MSVTVTAIENAIIARLAAQIPAAAAVESFSGKYLDERGERTWRYPLILVSLESETVDEEHSAFDRIRVELRFTIIIACRNLRSDAESRQGVYEVLDDVKTALLGQDLGLDMAPLEYQGAEIVGITKEDAAFGATFTTSGSWATGG